MMPIDHTLLHALRDALMPPFADPVRVVGVPMSRETARALHRNLSREKIAADKRKRIAAAERELERVSA